MFRGTLNDFSRLCKKLYLRLYHRSQPTRNSPNFILTMRHIEDNLQISCVRWFSLQYPECAMLLHHSPNGGKRNAKEAARFKAMGVRAGFPDLVLHIASGGYNGLFIELKTDKGRQTEHQKEQQALLEKQNYRYVVVRSIEEFINQIELYLTR